MKDGENGRGITHDLYLGLAPEATSCRHFVAGDFITFASGYHFSGLRNLKSDLPEVWRLRLLNFGSMCFECVGS